MSKNKKRRFKLWLILALIGIVALGFLTRTLLYQIPGWLLHADDAPEKDADYLLLLIGDDTSGRAEKAVDLFEQGYAPKILIAHERSDEFVRIGLEKSEADRHRDFLLAHDVPEDAVEVLRDCATTSTYEEALCFKAHLGNDTGSLRRLIVVTSWYHSARARWLFRRVFAGSNVLVQVVPAPLWETTPRNWWAEEKSFFLVFSEFVKWTYWLLTYPD